MKHHAQERKKDDLINWQPWSEQIFQQARQENKLILVDIGATWCHWCHVMDRTTYSDQRVADMINSRFVPVKIDRDERPDLDHIYQMAPTIIESRGGGWPLTIFLLPSGEALFRATYLPADSSDSTTGMLELAQRLQQLYDDRRKEVEQSAENLRQHLEEMTERDLGDEVTSEMLDKTFHHIRQAFDEKWGGFYATTHGPKFPAPGAMQFLLAYGHRRRSQTAHRIVAHTLTMMARGGIHDQLAGGFHRYAIDQQWHVPHFEKMLYDNAELLLCYLRAWRALGDDLFRETAEGILRFVDNVLADREHGGFFGSQDADVGPDDDGDAFTWTFDEVRQTIGEGPEFDLVVNYYGIREHGDMHHDPRRNVLRQMMTIDDLAAKNGRTNREIDDLIQSARNKLLQARNARPQPEVDRTLYVSWNAMMICAYVEAFWTLQRCDALDMARRTADRLLIEARAADGALTHIAGHSEPCGLLDDQAWMALALVELYAACGETRYLVAAENAVKWCRDQLWDDDLGGFYDRPEAVSADPAVITVDALRERPAEDSPSSSGNAIIALALQKLALALDRPEYRHLAMRTLSAFGAIIPSLSVHGGAMAHAAEVLLNGATRIVIVLTDDQSQALADAARGIYLPGKLLIILKTTEPSDRKLIEQYGFDPDGPTAAYVCRGQSCQPPAFDADALRHALRHG